MPIDFLTKKVTPSVEVPLATLREVEDTPSLFSISMASSWDELDRLSCVLGPTWCRDDCKIDVGSTENGWFSHGRILWRVGKYA